jgi:decaprenylphospho-beta-D-ribofuranose 2-oxidase
MTLTSISSWGIKSDGLVLQDFLENFDRKKYPKIQKGLAIGLGRSYGDSRFVSNGVHLTTFNLNGLQIDIDNAIAICGSGVTIGQLEEAAIAFGLFPPVVPGTKFVTIGGAIASDIHGKSQGTLGSFGDHVRSIQLLTAAGTVLNLRPNDETSGLFWGTVGGMGLTGAILSAELNLMTVKSPFIEVTQYRTTNLSETLSLVNQADLKNEYSVAWIDFSRKHQVRGIVSIGNHAQVESTNVVTRRKQSKTFSIPFSFPTNLVSNYVVTMFNTIWYHKPLVVTLTNYERFLHPLDTIQNWNVIFGSKGILQYQFLIPIEHVGFLDYAISEFKRIKLSSFLVVLKKFGKSSNSMLGFCKPGWTLAVDFPASNKHIYTLLDELDKELVKLEGRLYLTKDFRMKREVFELMYPRLEEWKAVKAQIDPDSYWSSDQGKRLGLS